MMNEVRFGLFTGVMTGISPCFLEFEGVGSLRLRSDGEFEVHGGEESVDDLQGMVVHSKANDAAAIGSDAAAGDGGEIEQ